MVNGGMIDPEIVIESESHLILILRLFCRFPDIFLRVCCVFNRRFSCDVIAVMLVDESKRSFILLFVHQKSDISLLLLVSLVDG